MNDNDHMQTMREDFDREISRDAAEAEGFIREILHAMTCKPDHAFQAVSAITMLAWEADGPGYSKLMDEYVDVVVELLAEAAE